MSLPQQESSKPAEAGLEERLGKSHIGLRNDLEVHRHVYQRRPGYVIRDPFTLQCFHLSLKEYRIFTNLTADSPLMDIFRALCRQGIMTDAEKDSFYRFVMQLHQLNFLHLPISDDKALYRRYRQRVKQQRKQWFLSALFLQIPLFNPDVFLNKTIHLGRVLFSKAFFFVYCLFVGISLAVIVNKFGEIRTFTGSVFQPDNLLVLWVTLIGLKAFHELGHAYACKTYGGQVNDMGLYLILLTPCAYVDVTSSWSFSSKLKRIMVALGGVYVESIIAMIALFCWCTAESMAARVFAYDIFFLASITTILMNINPLMRFDGYYILSDLVEIPNLRTRAQTQVYQTLKKTFLRIESPASSSPLMAVFLTVFGMAAFVYRIGIILGISAIIAGKALFLGVALASAYLGWTMLSWLNRIVHYLRHSAEAIQYRFRTTMAFGLLLIGLPAAALLVPIPFPIKVDGQLMRQREECIRVRQGGFIREVIARPGDWIQAGAPLMVLDDHQLQEMALETGNELEQKQHQLLAMQSDPYVNPAELPRQQEVIDAIKSRLDQCNRQLEDLTVASDQEGVLANSLTLDSVGRFIPAGEEFGAVINGDWICKAYIPQKEVAEIGSVAGRKIFFRLRARPGHRLEGEIISVAPAPADTLKHLALTSVGRGSVAVDPSTYQALEPVYEITAALKTPTLDFFKQGDTGQLLISSSPQTLGQRLHRQLLLFLQRMNLENEN